MQKLIRLELIQRVEGLPMLNLRALLKSGSIPRENVWAKVDPCAGCFTWNSEADYTADPKPPGKGFIFFANGSYIREHIESSDVSESDALDELLDEINQIAFPL